MTVGASLNRQSKGKLDQQVVENAGRDQPGVGRFARRLQGEPKSGAEQGCLPVPVSYEDARGGCTARAADVLQTTQCPDSGSKAKIGTIRREYLALCFSSA